MKYCNIIFLQIFIVFFSFSLTGQNLIDANFNADEDGFIYQDNLFRNANASTYASGIRSNNQGVNGTGALLVTLGGIDGNDISNMTGGWTRDFTLNSTEEIVITFAVKLLQTGTYEENEISEALLAIDGQLIGNGTKEYIDQIKGDGNNGPVIGTDEYFIFSKQIGPLNSGVHTIDIGGYNSLKTLANESTTVYIDDVTISISTNECDDPDETQSQKIVDLTSFTAYKDRVISIAQFGDRSQLSSAGSASYDNAEAWAIQYLQGLGYVVEFSNYTYQGDSRKSIYVTKIGTTNPDQMYIVSGHFDGRGGGQACDDDASGSAIVMEIARILSDPNITTDISVRMILWNNEESGLNGSAAYANSRNSQRGIENPPGSGLYPEPDWLGVIQHDMMMFDHGSPVQANQIEGADIDIEFQQSSTFANQSEALAHLVKQSNISHASDYPSEVTNNMNNTDSKSFQNFCPSISLRENRRVAEIGSGMNPHWHQPTDVVSTYSDDDFRLAYNSLQSTLGMIASLTNAEITGELCDPFSDIDGDGIVDAIDNCPNTFNDDQMDQDNDDIGDVCDSCPSLDNALIGTPCDDGDPCTAGELYDTNCGCSGGQFQDADNDSICDGLDQCPGIDDALIGTPCDDGDPCTVGEIYDSSCQCSGGAFEDTDNDGICDANDQCPGMDDAMIGQACDDGQACTTGDAYNSSCECVGVSNDADNDNVCDALDQCPGIDDALIGTPCDDGDPCTVGEIYDSSCQCSGGAFEDTDNDGICDASDQCPGMDDAMIGQACDDGQACTTGDAYNSSCECVGVSNDADNDNVCDALDQCPGVDDALIGQPCDDGDSCTSGDIYNTSCECAGVSMDSDGDNICDALDVCPFLDDSLIGQPCDDGNVCTEGETYSANCLCENGVLVDVNQNGICDLGEGCSSMYPLVESFEMDLGSWTQDTNDDADWTRRINNTPTSGTGPTSAADGDWYIYLEASGANYPNKSASIISECIDATNVSSVNLSFVYHQYGTVNDMMLRVDVSTDNQASWSNPVWSITGIQANEWLPIDIDLSTYIGELIHVRITATSGNFYRGDIAIDLVEVTAVSNCQTVGASCEDGDVCTEGEVFDAFCNCVNGSFADSDNDGVCNAMDQCEGFDDAIDNDADGIPDSCDDCINIIEQTGFNSILDNEQANQLIISDGFVPNGENVIFKAGDSILLKPSFEVILGAVFEAKIEPCQ